MGCQKFIGKRYYDERGRGGREREREGAGLRKGDDNEEITACQPPLGIL